MKTIIKSGDVFYRTEERLSGAGADAVRWRMTVYSLGAEYTVMQETWIPEDEAWDKVPIATYDDPARAREEAMRGEGS